MPEGIGRAGIAATIVRLLLTAVTPGTLEMILDAMSFWAASGTSPLMVQAPLSKDSWTFLP